MISLNRDIDLMYNECTGPDEEAIFSICVSNVCINRHTYEFMIGLCVMTILVNIYAVQVYDYQVCLSHT